MIDSVPLIQNANDAQQINASIIAMKKASRELDEKILKLNNLNSELDKKIALLDSGLTQEIADRQSADNTEVTNRNTAITNAINALDVSSVGGSGKYISAISETDGKISATASDLATTVSSGNSQPVTSGGVADALNVPTDAVLHYSFDDVPDYPDGTANVRLLNNNTYDIQSGSFRFREFRSTTFTNSNGNVVLNMSANSSGSSGAYISGTYCANKIIKAKIKITALNGSIDISNGKGTNGVIVAIYSTVGVYEFSLLHNPNAQYNNIYIATQNASESATVEILAVYIGDGSYSTPIIDNANGQNNATNNGGIAVQGVSGKGVYLLERKYANIGTAFQFNANFSVSVWVKPDNNTNTLIGNIVRKSSVLVLRNGSSGYPNLTLNLYGANTHLVTDYVLAPLLTPNVWSSLILTREGTTLKFYLNGELLKTITLANNTIATNSLPLTIGGYTDIPNTRPQSYDDLLIFNRALSDTEVQALYLNKANTPKYYSWADWKLSQV